MKSKSLKVAEYFLANPQATPKDVGKKFKMAMPSVYGIRKRVLSGSMLDKVSPQITDAVTQANDKQVGGSHYKDNAIQPWDYIVRNEIGYLEGNVIKYVSRWKDKGGVADLEKAKHYLEKLIEVSGG